MNLFSLQFLCHYLGLEPDSIFLYDTQKGGVAILIFATPPLF